MGRAKGEEHVQMVSSHEVLSYLNEHGPKTAAEISHHYLYSCHRGAVRRLEKLIYLGAATSISNLRELEYYQAVDRSIGTNPTFKSKVYVITSEGKEILRDWGAYGCNRRAGEPLPLKGCKLCPPPRQAAPPIKREHGNFMPGQRGKAPSIGAS